MKEQVIYKIINLVTDKFYVGSTYNKPERFRSHRNKLRRGKHPNAHLQASWNKYGEEKFLFKVIEVIPEGQSLQDAEDVWLIEHVGKEHCYNLGLRSDAPWRGGKKEDHPCYGRVVSQEERQAISAGLKETYAANPERHPRLGKKHSPEAIAKMKANKYVTYGEDHYNFGKTRTDEVKKKIGDTQRGIPKGEGRTISAEGMAKIKAAAALGHYSHQKGSVLSEATKEKMSKPVKELTEGKTFTSLTNALEYYEMLMPTLTRALKTGKPIIKGDKRGLQFAYISSDDLTEDKNPNLRGERFAASAVDYSKCSIDGCDRPYAGNGYCMMHYKQSRKGTLNKVSP